MADQRARPTVRPQRLALGVLARAPIADVTEVRLAPRFGPSERAEIATALLSDTLTSLSLLPMAHRAVLCVSGDESAALRSIVPSRWKIVSSDATLLEERLAKGLAYLFASGAEGAAILAGDVPLLPLDEIFEALLWATKTMPQRRLVLGPSASGGLYVVATSRPEPALFDGVDWTSKGVIDRARARAEELGIETQVLKTVNDIEGPDDLTRLAKDLASGAAGPGTVAPASSALLSRLGIRA